MTLADEIKIIDTDTHVIEPADLWTSRVATKWGDRIPRVEYDDERGADVWVFGGDRIKMAWTSAFAGHDKFPPYFPRTLDEVDPATWDPKQRLQRMDERGIFAQVLYPNVAGFGAGQFLKAQDPDLMYELVRAYNDFLVDFSSTDSDRYIPVMAVPFWDVDLSVREIHRAAEIGHKGIVFGGYPEYFGEPDITDRHWEPIWSTAEEMGLAINFHVASGDTTNLFDGHLENGEHANFASNGVSYFLGNGRVIAKVICAGVCHRHPRLKFVSVESGIGWLPYFCHALDWQWQQSGAHLEHPDYLLPSEYFKRQFYGCFWSEVETALSAIELMGSSNFMFETDFPHPTSLEPGPASIAPDPKTHINEFFSRMKRRDAEAILHDNAAAVYGLTV